MTAGSRPKVTKQDGWWGVLVEYDGPNPEPILLRCDHHRHAFRVARCFADYVDATNSAPNSMKAAKAYAKFRVTWDNVEDEP